MGVQNLRQVTQDKTRTRQLDLDLGDMIAEEGEKSPAWLCFVAALMIPFGHSGRQRYCHCDWHSIDSGFH